MFLSHTSLDADASGTKGSDTVTFTG